MFLKALPRVYVSGRFLGTMTSVFSRKDVKYLSQDEAILVDQLLFSKYGYKVEQLMELAGLACAKAVTAQYSKGKVLVLCGPGNNGGDGFVCARHLLQFGYQPTVVYPKTSKNELMETLVAQMKALDIPVLPSLPPLDDISLVVDALFGFSFQPPVRPPFDEIIEKVARSGIYTFCIDIPSGWDVENGAPSSGPSIHPHSIISLTAPKTCMREWTGPHYLGGRFVPPALVDQFGLKLPRYPGADQIVKIE